MVAGNKFYFPRGICFFEVWL